jgi:NADPH:quinone reductase-like Zn-dependent oxidoreductase
MFIKINTVKNGYQMKCVTLTQVKSPLVISDREPLKPGAGEAVVRLHAAAANRRDFWITRGMYPGIEPPVVLGSDGAGVVTACGTSSDEHWIDQEVVINPGVDWGENDVAQSQDFKILGLPDDGTFAEEVIVPATQLFAKPDHLNWEQAAALPLAGVTAFRALFTKGLLKEGETVVISGVGGGVASIALTMAVASGAKVFVTSSSDEKIKRAVELGAQGGFNYQVDGWVKELNRSTGGVNLILDSAAGRGYGNLIEAAAFGGRIVNYGATTGPPEQLDMFKVFWKQLSLLGSTMGSPRDFQEMLDFVVAHRVVPIVDQVLPLKETNEAIELLKSSPQFGKIVLSV